MDIFHFLNNNSPVFTWVILPIMIFAARITDQSIGTLRLIFVSKGLKYIAPFIGFFESIIWLLAVSQIMKHLDNVICFVAYGSGFATGNYIGILLEEKISIGNAIIRIITRNDAQELIHYLRSNNYGITVVDATGSQGNVKIIFSTVKRKNLSHFVSIINDYNPNAFYTIEDVKSVNEGIFPHNKSNLSQIQDTRKAK
ncbi:MAG: DUF2179 domain-containing protein [Bacteroidia bacterium]|nr:DUF2179 domain-containing protein [Bacteroidia bacterium]